MTLDEFISAHLHTVDHLRVLLHLKGAPRTEWDVLDVAGKLYLPPLYAATVLRQLAAQGLASTSGDPPRYRYAPGTPELAGLVDKLEEMDRTQPVTLINRIYARHPDIQAFAEAFKLKTEGKD